mmetsp:Transcript_5412/g.11028  ORF Transcript_5412/g.11028 Transcript_5412/m.11028 type:complete len:314 (+) Transcript_5412:784-1725(+)
MELLTHGNCALGLVKGNKGVKIPALAVELRRGTGSDLESQEALHVELPRAMLHHFVVEVPHVSREVRHVDTVDGVVLIVCDTVHVEGHQRSWALCLRKQRWPRGGTQVWAAAAQHRAIRRGAALAANSQAFAAGVGLTFGPDRLTLCAVWRGPACQRRRCGHRHDHDLWGNGRHNNRSQGGHCRGGHRGWRHLRRWGRLRRRRQLLWLRFRLLSRHGRLWGLAADAAVLLGAVEDRPQRPLLAGQHGTICAEAEEVIGVAIQPRGRTAVHDGVSVEDAQGIAVCPAHGVRALARHGLGCGLQVGLQHRDIDRI